MSLLINLAIGLKINVFLKVQSTTIAKMKMPVTIRYDQNGDKYVASKSAMQKHVKRKASSPRISTMMQSAVAPRKMVIFSAAVYLAFSR